MRILPLSDLHHELWCESAPRIDPAISQPDVVVLAGDIDTGAKAVEWAANTFTGIPVIYVHGNHESYGKNLEHMHRDIEEACAASGNVHFLNCDEVILGQVRFLGATMWTDFRLFGDDDRQLAMREAESVMSDYKRIRVAESGYRKLRVSDTARFHGQHKSWLNQKLSEPFDGKTVVVTHMAPSMRSVSEYYAEDLISAAYASNLDELVQQADLWIHGHMHESFDYQIGDCRVVCNPCGYKIKGGVPENTKFNPDLILNLGH